MVSRRVRSWSNPSGLLVPRPSKASTTRTSRVLRQSTSWERKLLQKWRRRAWRFTSWYVLTSTPEILHALKKHHQAHDYAEKRGIIIADTKFEFGLDPSTNEIILIDEVLTPDSSRFWPLDKYEVGRGQSSYDKQYLRDWLTSSGLKGKDGVAMPAEIVRETASKYREAYEKLTGKAWH